MISLLLAEDHAVVRSGLKMLLAAEEDMQVVGEASTGREAVQLAREKQPDVVVMDISMPELNGLEAARQLQRECPGVRVLMLTMHDSEEYFFQALEAGALGYVPKSAAEAEVLAAIRSVYRGQAYLHPTVARLLVGDYLERVKNGEEREGFAALTEREREILRLVAEGYTNREIADMLCLSVHTVHNHRARLMEKLGAHDRLELLKLAVRKGILQV